MKSGIGINTTSSVNKLNFLAAKGLVCSQPTLYCLFSEIRHVHALPTLTFSSGKQYIYEIVVKISKLLGFGFLKSADLKILTETPCQGDSECPA